MSPSSSRNPKRVVRPSENVRVNSQANLLIRPSGFGFLSKFGFRTSDFGFGRPCGTPPAAGRFPALKRRAIIGKSLWDFIAGLVILMFFAFVAHAETTNSLTDAEIQGRALAQKILAQRPAENSTNTGVLDIHNDNGKRTKIPFFCETVVTGTNWQSIYSTVACNSIYGVTAIGGAYFGQVAVVHSAGQRNLYELSNVKLPPTETNSSIYLSDGQMIAPFANSDFWLCDLGLEFFHWPQQKVLKKEFHRQCACMVLESTNPNPSADAYSRVVCWIDEDSLGIVEAYAYDAQGKKLKNFYPKNFEKVHGQYQVESMVMENLQTGSTSRLEFDLDK